MRAHLILIGLAALYPAAVLATESGDREVGVEASITFPTHGGIRNFRADDDRGLWIEDNRRNWYYASFFGRCQDARFAEAIGVDTRGSARFDRYSAIIVGSERCAIDRLVTADEPLPAREQARYAKEAREALKAGQLD